jgi:hypothetical protein
MQGVTHDDHDGFLVPVDPGEQLGEDVFLSEAVLFGQGQEHCDVAGPTEGVLPAPLKMLDEVLLRDHSVSSYPSAIRFNS